MSSDDNLDTIEPSSNLEGEFDSITVFQFYFSCFVTLLIIIINILKTGATKSPEKMAALVDKENTPNSHYHKPKKKGKKYLYCLVYYYLPTLTTNTLTLLLLLFICCYLLIIYRQSN